MVKNIYFIEIPYSNFQKTKGRPILIFKELENDFLFLPLTSNLSRNGIILKNLDLSKGNLKKDSVVIVPKISAIDKNLIKNSRYIATVKNEKFLEILDIVCFELNCKKLKEK